MAKWFIWKLQGLFGFVNGIDQIELHLWDTGIIFLVEILICLLDFRNFMLEILIVKVIMFFGTRII